MTDLPSLPEMHDFPYDGHLTPDQLHEIKEIALSNKISYYGIERFVSKLRESGYKIVKV